ncbi:MAG: NAD(P)-dependent alcohol dehydrogenase [Prevotella sp.]|nr:NAD(P)-dependent alcohol dehydrogenase [Prevotella sp.]
MKKVTQNQYGDTSVLKIIDCDKPRITGKAEVLVKVQYSSLNAIDWKNRKGLFRIFSGWFSPRSQPGFDIVGSIVNKSDDVNDLEIGDKILSLLGTLKGGAFSQYVIINAKYAIKINPSADETIFAGLPMAASTAWMALVNHGKIKRGDKVLINGGSSGVGHYAIQIAKHYGAEVTAVTSEKNEAFCRELGADNTVDYQNEKYIGKTEQYNIIFDVVSNSSFHEIKPILAPNGIYIDTNMSLSLIKDLLIHKQVKFVSVHPDRKVLQEIVQMTEFGKLKTHIAKIFPMNNITEAHEEIEHCHTVGKIIIKID